ncbi:hypothetical protein [Methylobacterium frigidaeris]|uniref:Secreted protein n=1 Tax=Methylobacterium frigidaeris TaxID=2038277 RepID=A0AA37HIJ6_9HYPH|nr:hypothetical protein [Methylobacterium frigidaeris]GJD66449.1 hypothetical protein MPEAHAMD_6647 [Methylobacterium frigidaeris]
MTFDGVKFSVCAAIALFILPASGTRTARSETAVQVAQRVVPAFVHAPVRASPTEPRGRPVAIEREHLRAQRIIDRVCVGC